MASRTVRKGNLRLVNRSDIYSVVAMIPVIEEEMISFDKCLIDNLTHFQIAEDCVRNGNVRFKEVMDYLYKNYSVMIEEVA